MIFTNLKSGWCEFNLENFHGTPSYISSVPTNILEGILSYYRSGSMAITFDEEGSFFILVASSDLCMVYIIAERDEREAQIYTFEIYPDDLCKQLYKEVMDREEEWVEWIASDFRDEQHYRDYIRLLDDDIRHIAHE